MHHTHEVWINSITNQSQVCYREGFKPSGSGWEAKFFGTIEQCNCYVAGYRVAFLKSGEAQTPGEVEKRPEVFFIHREGGALCCSTGSNVPTKYTEMDVAVDVAKKKAMDSPGTRFMVLAPVAAVIVNLPEAEVTLF